MVEATLTLKKQELFHSVPTIFELEYGQINFITERQSWSMLILDQNTVYTYKLNDTVEWVPFLPGLTLM
jgi:uncharacterized membrane protein